MAEPGGSAVLTLSEPSSAGGRPPVGDVAGQAIPEPPPLVEPVGFADSFTEGPILAPHRPERRRFLPPQSRSGGIADRPPLPDVRPRLVEYAPLAVVPDAASPVEPALPAVPAAIVVETTNEALAVSPPAPKAARRRVVPTLEIIALVLVVLTGAGMLLRPGWVAPLRERVAHLLPGAAVPHQNPVRADPAQRFAANLDAAKNGNVEAQLAVAIQYAKADGAPRDYMAAAKWFRAAAEAGNTRAQYDLGVLYERGRGVPLDYPLAVTWYRKAADGRHPLAQYNLAVAYTKGEGVERNFFEAAVWYNRAALQGVIAAMVNLAILYERGEGVENSPANAYAWYRAAARRGSQPASRRADELLAAFTPWEQTQAEAKTTEIALQIQDSVGESARAAAQSRAAPAPAGPSPALKSGFEKENGPAPSADAADLTP